MWEAAEQSAEADEAGLRMEPRSLAQCSAGLSGRRVTPDGISSVDWDRVKELAAEVVNLSGADQYEASDAVARELVALLLALENKYGPLPSLLATRADYVESTAERGDLLLASYRESKRRGDVRSQAWIAHSLASHYVEAVPDSEEGDRWLHITQQHLQAFPDEEVDDDLYRLRAVLRRRRRRAALPEQKGRRTKR